MDLRTEISIFHAIESYDSLASVWLLSFRITSQYICQEWLQSLTLKSLISIENVFDLLVSFRPMISTT